MFDHRIGQRGHRQIEVADRRNLLHATLTLWFFVLLMAFMGATKPLLAAVTPVRIRGLLDLQGRRAQTSEK